MEKINEKENRIDLSKTSGHEPRTLSQNSALHLYCQQVADECLANGITLKVVAKAVEDFGIYPDRENIKSFFRSLAKAKYHKSSTASLTKNELQDIYITLRQAMLNVGIFTEFPSQDSLNAQELYNKEIL